VYSNPGNTGLDATLESASSVIGANSWFIVRIAPADQLFAREWIGVALAALGLAFLAATLEGTGDEAHSNYESARLVAWITGVSCLASVVAFAGRRGPNAGVVLGASAGLFWAASDTSIKALSGQLDDGALAVLVDPLAVVIALASFIGLVVSARSLQLGKAVPVIAVTSVAANVFTIAAGPVVFEEPLPDTTLGVIVRLLAFVLVIGAAALTPAPVRAVEA
jgi:hypothetical protein